MIDYPPEVTELLARGAEVTWYPLANADGQIVDAVIIGVAWPLYWDSPCFRDAKTGRSTLATQAPRRRDDRPRIMPRAGPVVSPIAAQAP